MPFFAIASIGALSAMNQPGNNFTNPFTGQMVQADSSGYGGNAYSNQITNANQYNGSSYNSGMGNSYNGGNNNMSQFGGYGNGNYNGMMNSPQMHPSQAAYQNYQQPQQPYYPSYGQNSNMYAHPNFQQQMYQQQEYAPQMNQPYFNQAPQMSPYSMGYGSNNIFNQGFGGYNSYGGMGQGYQQGYGGNGDMYNQGFGQSYGGGGNGGYGAQNQAFGGSAPQYDSQGMDSAAASQSPEAFAQYYRGAQQQEQSHPGSTFLNNGQSAGQNNFYNAGMNAAGSNESPSINQSPVINQSPISNNYNSGINGSGGAGGNVEAGAINNVNNVTGGTQYSTNGGNTLNGAGYNSGFGSSNSGLDAGQAAIGQANTQYSTYGGNAASAGYNSGVDAGNQGQFGIGGLIAQGGIGYNSDPFSGMFGMGAQSSPDFSGFTGNSSYNAGQSNSAGGGGAGGFLSGALSGLGGGWLGGGGDYGAMSGGAVQGSAAPQNNTDSYGGYGGGFGGLFGRMAL
jgi:hypothetical protein